jgi:hypothetical protein
MERFNRLKVPSNAAPFHPFRCVKPLRISFTRRAAKPSPTFGGWVIEHFAARFAGAFSTIAKARAATIASRVFPRANNFKDRATAQTLFADAAAGAGEATELRVSG